MTQYTRFPSKSRRLGCGLLGLVAVVLVLATSRDLPRSIAERLLSRTLDARVRIESLELSNTGAGIRGLLVEAPGTRPEVESFAADVLYARGAWRDLLAGRIAHATLGGARLTLQPPEREAPPPSTDLVLDRLEIDDLEVVLPASADSPESPTVLTVEAELQGRLSALTGRVEVRGETLPFSALTPWIPDLPAELSGNLFQPEANFEIGDEITLDLGGYRLRVSAGEALLREVLPGATRFGEVTADVDELRLRATLTRRSGLGASLETELEGQLETGPIALPLGDEPFTFTSPWTRWELQGSLEGREARGGLRASWPGLPNARMELEGSLGSGGPTSASLAIRDWSWAETVAGTGAEGELDLDLDWVPERATARAELRPVSVRVPGVDLEALEAEIHAAGEWSPAGTLPVRLAVEIRRAVGTVHDRTLPGTLFPLRLEIDGSVSPSEGPRIAGDAVVSHPRLGQLASRGNVTLGSGTETLQPDLTWRWTEADLETLFELATTWHGDPEAEIVRLARRARGRLAGQGTLSGSLLAPEVTAALSLDRLQLDLPSTSQAPEPMILELAQLQNHWRWPGPNGVLELLDLQAEGTLPALSPIPESPFRVQARGEIGFEPMRADLEEIRLSLPSLLTATANLRAEPAADGLHAEGSGRVEDLDLARWQEILLVPDLGFAASGAARIVLPSFQVRGRSWTTVASLELDQLGLASEDASRVLEGLTASWDAEAEGELGGALQLSATGASAGFLLLWDTFFADFSELDATWQIEAEKTPAPSPWQFRMTGSIPQGPRIDSRVAFQMPGSGTEDASVEDFDLELEIADLAQMYQRYLAGQDVFGDLFLGGTGFLRLEGSPLPSGGWRLAGKLSTTDLAWRRDGGDTLVEDLDLELPFDLELVEGAASGPRLHGSIAAGRLAFRRLGLAIPATGLWIEGDALGFEEALSLEALGGTVTFEGLALEALARADRHFTGGLRLDGLDLGHLTRRLETLPLEGTLDGFFPRFSLGAEDLRVAGGGVLELFGGTVEFRDIAGSEIFTPFPRLRLDADFRDLDLLQITRRFDFGEMSGLVSGSLRDAELFRGIPVALRTRIATTHRRGVPRTVDVKAVNNLSILGTGGGGFGRNPVDRWFQRFFQSYTYSALGVDIELAGDALLLRGLEKRGDRELFLRGRLPFRIDIVNAQPGRTVSFRAMRQRFEQLDFSAATTVPGG